MRYLKNRIVDALSKLRMMIRNIIGGHYHLARFNSESAIAIMRGPYNMSKTETFITIVLALTLALCAVYLSTQSAPSVPVCPEDSAIVLFGRGQYEGGEWESYDPVCIAVDDFMETR